MKAAEFASRLRDLLWRSFLGETAQPQPHVIQITLPDGDMMEITVRRYPLNRCDTCFEAADSCICDPLALQRRAETDAALEEASKRWAEGEQPADSILRIRTPSGAVAVNLATGHVRHF